MNSRKKNLEKLNWVYLIISLTFKKKEVKNIIIKNTTSIESFKKL